MNDCPSRRHVDPVALRGGAGGVLADRGGEGRETRQVGHAGELARSSSAAGRSTPSDHWADQPVVGSPSSIRSGSQPPPVGPTRDRSRRSRSAAQSRCSELVERGRLRPGATTTPPTIDRRRSRAAPVNDDPVGRSSAAAGRAVVPGGVGESSAKRGVAADRHLSRRPGARRCPPSIEGAGDRPRDARGQAAGSPPAARCRRRRSVVRVVAHPAPGEHLPDRVDQAGVVPPCSSAIAAVRIASRRSRKTGSSGAAFSAADDAAARPPARWPPAAGPTCVCAQISPSAWTSGPSITWREVARTCSRRRGQPALTTPTGQSSASVRMTCGTESV